MLKKTITFTDFDGVSRTEDHYFNLTKAEITEMELSKNGGLTTVINRIVSEKDTPALAASFKEILRRAYGKKSDDGRRFMKSGEIWKEFEESGAYDVFFMELIQNAGKAADFVNGILPKDLRDKGVKEGAPDAVTATSGG